MTEKVSIYILREFIAHIRMGKGAYRRQRKGPTSLDLQRRELLAYMGLVSQSKGSRRWLLLPPTSTIHHSVPLSLPALTSISNLYSATPTVFSRTLSTSSSDGIYFNAMTRSRSSKKHKDNEFKLKINSHRKHYRMMSTYEKINLRIVRVHSESDLVLSGITDETLVIR